MNQEHVTFAGGRSFRSDPSLQLAARGEVRGEADFIRGPSDSVVASVRLASR